MPIPYLDAKLLHSITVVCDAIVIVLKKTLMTFYILLKYAIIVGIA